MPHRLVPRVREILPALDGLPQRVFPSQSSTGVSLCAIAFAADVFCVVVMILSSEIYAEDHRMDAFHFVENP